MHALTFVQNPEQTVEISYIPTYSWALTVEKTYGAFPTKDYFPFSLVCVCLKLSIYGLLPRNMNEA